MRFRPLLFALLATSLLAAACSSDGDPEMLTLFTHDSFADAVTDETFAAFTEETGIAVDVVPGGDAGSVVTQAALTKDNPLGDVLFGVDDTFLSRAIENDVFEAYQSGLLSSVDPALVPSTDLVTPIDFGDVCFNYDKAYFETADLEVPSSLEQLATETYAPLITVEHPATSSPGLAFMLATIAELGEEGWLDWWRQMKEAGVNVVPDWNTAYYGEFTRYDGASPIVLSYASSPPAEVIFSETPLDVAPTGVVEAGCYRQVEYAGVMAGTEHPEAAGALIDFMLSKEFQETIPSNWFVFPANQQAALPQEFIEHTTVPAAPARLDPDVIAENRDRWLREWVSVMEG